jgi:hypothetical protein
LSRRKDRERFEAMKRVDPDYKGFRGRREEPDRSGKTPLEAATCRICGRKRNIPRGIAVEQGENYACATCTEAGRAADVQVAQQSIEPNVIR